MHHALQINPEAESAQSAQFPHSSTSPEDKRRFPRDPAKDLSEIVLAGRKFGYACMIHDLSKKGARLEVSCGELPERFILTNYTKQIKTLCKQVWRENRMIGVMFLTEPRSFDINDRF